MKILPVVLIFATFLISAALASDDPQSLTEDQEVEWIAICYPILKPLLSYVEKCHDMESQSKKEYSELKKNYTDLEKKGQESYGQISQLQRNYSELQKKYFDLEVRGRKEYDQISQLQMNTLDLHGQIYRKNFEIKILKDQISVQAKTSEVEKNQLREDIAKLRELLKNTKSDNVTAIPSPTRTVQQHPPPSKALPDRCPQSQNETKILQEIQVPGSDPFKVVCYSYRDIGSGWMTIYRHYYFTKNYFNRTYEEYERGFGDVGTRLEDNYFVGLERLHLLTTSNSYELYIGPEDTCDHFMVGNRSEDYMVKDIRGCTGRILPNLMQAKFSTWDQDQDGLPNRNSAKDYGYGWWYEPRSNRHYNVFHMIIRRKD